MKKWIEKKLGGYRQQVVRPDPGLPVRLTTEKSVTVIGAGLAGIGAAAVLGERGFRVKLLDKNSYLGGKVGSWPVTFEDGFTSHVEHGFHAFFRQYYNLNAFLKKLDLSKHLIPIEDYLILSQDFGNLSFRDVETTPLLNILSMRKHGAFRLTDLLFSPRSMRLLDLFRFRPASYDKYDHVSFETFADNAGLSEKLRMVFNSFSRAFFSEPGLMSSAELIKGFHTYFLSNDGGLLYDVLKDDFSKTLLDPVRNHLMNLGVKISLDCRVSGIEHRNSGFSVSGEPCDFLVLATDVKGTKSLVAASQQLCTSHTGFADQISRTKTSQRYAVLRLWTDKDVSGTMPFFVFTDRTKLLDSVTFYHKMENTSARWAKENGGGIYELHSYAVTDDFVSEAGIRRQLIAEFERYFPEILPYHIRYEVLQVRDDFTAFHTGLYKDRPATVTEVPGLFLAGDWVRLPYPMMLMEAAYTSGVLAANQILDQEGLQAEPVFSVPLRGLFA